MITCFCELCWRVFWGIIFRLRVTGKLMSCDCSCQVFEGSSFGLWRRYVIISWWLRALRWRSLVCILDWLMGDSTPIHCLLTDSWTVWIVLNVLMFFVCVIFFSHSALFGDDVTSLWQYSTSVDQYSAAGGTALSSVRQQVADLKAWLGTLSGNWARL
jgi:hypothetical protein